MGLSNVLAHLAKTDDLGFFSDLVTNYLKNKGGAAREDILVRDIRALSAAQKSNTILKNQIVFLLEASNKCTFSPEDDSYYTFWYLTAEDKKKAITAVLKLIPLFETKRTELAKGLSADKIFADAANEMGIPEEVLKNYAAISKKFAQNKFGDFGLAAWSEIKPKTARDWAHLVLRKEKKPLHFTHIAKMVNTLRKDRPVHHQTVHNELIKDENFVLVGKGMYGLKEFGLVPGTAREVIERFLKQKGPLHADTVVELVLQERFFKPNTILVNLQNKKYFERLPNGQYTVREA